MSQKQKTWLIPLLIATVFIGIFSLMFGPLLNMKPQDLPVAAVMNDQGIETPKGYQEAGPKVLEQMEEKFSETGALQLEEVKAGEFNANDYFAVITVPEDFTKDMASETGAIEFSLNHGKNPIVAMQLQQMISKVDLGDSGVKLEPTTYNPVDPELGFAANLLPTALIMMTLVPSMIGGKLISSNGRRWMQLLLATITSTFIGFAISVMITWITPLSEWNVYFALYVSLASFAMLVLTMGAVRFFGQLGLIVPVTCLVLGLSTGMLPRQFLPGFWSNFAWFITPVHNLTDGVREILYLDQTWSKEALGLVIAGCIGLALWALPSLRRTPNSAAENNDTPTSDKPLKISS